MGLRIIAFFKKSKIAQITLVIIAVIIILTLVIPAISHTIYTGIMANLLTMMLQFALLIATAGAVFFFAKSEICEMVF